MKTQKERVLNKLVKTGFITRNEALRNYISRLSAIILSLKEDGWEFDTKIVKNDYVYTVSKCPLKKTTYKAGDKIIEVVK